MYLVQNRFIKGNGSEIVKIHTRAKTYAAGNNTRNMIKKTTEKDKNIQKVAQGLKLFCVINTHRHVKNKVLCTDD